MNIGTNCAIIVFTLENYGYLKGKACSFIRYSLGNVIGTDKTTSYCRSDVIFPYTKVHLLNKEKHVLL